MIHRSVWSSLADKKKQLSCENYQIQKNELKINENSTSGQRKLKVLLRAQKIIAKYHFKRWYECLAAWSKIQRNERGLGAFTSRCTLQNNDTPIGFSCTLCLADVIILKMNMQKTLACHVSIITEKRLAWPTFTGGFSTYVQPHRVTTTAATAILNQSSSHQACPSALIFMKALRYRCICMHPGK